MKQGYLAYFWVSASKLDFLKIFTSPDKTQWEGKKTKRAFHFVYLVKNCSYERLFKMNLKRIIIYLSRVFLTLIITVFCKFKFFSEEFENSYFINVLRLITSEVYVTRISFKM